MPTYSYDDYVSGDWEKQEKPAGKSGKKAAAPKEVTRSYDEYLAEIGQEPITLTPPAPKYTKGEAAVTGAIMGATANTALPAAAYATSRAPMQVEYDPMGNVISATPISDAGPSYEQKKAEYQGKIEQMKEQQPGAYYTGNVVGAVASPLNKVGGVVKGTSTLATVGRGAVTGATYGGVAGGAETGTLEGAATGAVLGGTVGAVGSGVTRGAQNVFDRISATEISKRITEALKMPKQVAVSTLQKMFPELEGAGAKETFEQATRYQQALVKDPSQMARFGVQDTNPETWMSAGGKTLTQMGTGAAAGYGAGLVIPGADPKQMALAGALGTPVLRGMGVGSNLMPIVEKVAVPLSNNQFLATTNPMVGSFARGVSSAVTGVTAPTSLREANAQLHDLFNK